MPRFLKVEGQWSYGGGGFGHGMRTPQKCELACLGRLCTRKLYTG